MRRGLSGFLGASLIRSTDTVTDFAWEPRGERFAIVTSSDPNLGNVGPGIAIKTEVIFYQLDVAAQGGKYRLLSELSSCPSGPAHLRSRKTH